MNSRPKSRNGKPELNDYLPFTPNKKYSAGGGGVGTTRGSGPLVGRDRLLECSACNNFLLF